MLTFVGSVYTSREEGKRAAPLASIPKVPASRHLLTNATLDFYISHSTIADQAPKFFKSP